MIDHKTSIHYIPKETLEPKNLICILHYNTIGGKNSEKKKKLQYYQAFHTLKVQDNKHKKKNAILHILHPRFKPNQERGKMTIMKNGWLNAKNEWRHEYQLVYDAITEEGWWNGRRINKHKQLVVWDTKKGKTTRNIPHCATMIDSVMVQSNGMVENDL